MRDRASRAEAARDDLRDSLAATQASGAAQGAGKGADGARQQDGTAYRRWTAGSQAEGGAAEAAQPALPEPPAPPQEAARASSMGPSPASHPVTYQPS
eukprot:10356421-Alexandrium_andersonii.AAC.1